MAVYPNAVYCTVLHYLQSCIVIETQLHCNTLKLNSNSTQYSDVLTVLYALQKLEFVYIRYSDLEESGNLGTRFLVHFRPKFGK